MSRKEKETSCNYTWNYALTVFNIMIVSSIVITSLIMEIEPSFIFMFGALFIVNILATAHNLRFLQLSFIERIYADNFRVARITLWFLVLCLVSGCGLGIHYYLKYRKCRKERGHLAYTCPLERVVLLGLVPAAISIILMFQSISYYRYTRKLLTIKKELERMH